MFMKTFKCFIVGFYIIIIACLWSHAHTHTHRETGGGIENPSLWDDFMPLEIICELATIGGAIGGPMDIINMIRCNWIGNRGGAFKAFSNLGCTGSPSPLGGVSSWLACLKGRSFPYDKDWPWWHKATAIKPFLQSFPTTHLASYGTLCKKALQSVEKQLKTSQELPQETRNRYSNI